MRPGLIIVLAAVLLTAGCGNPPPGVEVDGQRLPVVDLHLHAGTWDQLPPWFQNRVSERVPRGFKWTVRLLSDYTLSGKGILSELDRGGISAGGVFALYSPHTTGLAPNEFVSEQVSVDPQRLYGFASIRVDQWNVDQQAQLAKFESDLKNLPHMVGVKLAHAHQQFRFDDERYYGIYEVAGRLGKPIYLHTATSPNPGTRFEPPYCDPAYLEEAIQRYPETIFILGHAGWDSRDKTLKYADAAIDLALRYDNVYMEPGALGARRAEAVLPDFLGRIKRANAAQKLIYGSDGPQFPTYAKSHLNAFVTGMQNAGFTTEEMRMILADNFSRVFGLPKFEVANSE